MVIDPVGVVRPTFRREYGWKGFVPRGQYMDIWEVRVSWSCDDTGGESPPDTWPWPGGGVTCLLITGAPQIADDKRYGRYVALYAANGGWVDSPTP